MKIEELNNMVLQAEQQISIDDLSNDELLELCDEELLQIAGGGWLDDVIRVLRAGEPLLVPLIGG